MMRFWRKMQDAEKTSLSDLSQVGQLIAQVIHQLQFETSQREKLELQISQLDQKLETEILHTQQLLTRISELANKIDGGTLETQQLALRLPELDQKIETEITQTQQLAARLSNLGLLTNQTRESINIQDRRLTVFIEEARKRLSDPLAREHLTRVVDDHIQHRYDFLYAAFEDVFRGSREEIKTRQAVYLSLLTEHSIGSSSMPLLDLGCGRGEWLELLGEHGLQASGVDSNEVMIERCRSLGLPVEQGDSLAHLNALPDECLGAVTAFHMVEHMPFEVILRLIDEILRVLKPGGVVILETPNPANFSVGAHTFHLDPTHLKPLPSPMLRFFVEGRGFCNVQVRELHPYPEAVLLPNDNGGVASRFNESFYGAQDYAVIGRKP